MTDETLFIAALEKPAAERSAFLDAACAVDTAQRKRLDELLAGHERAAGILDQSDHMQPPSDREDHSAVRAGVVLADRYKLLEEIGTGGMGTVWVAEQVRPVRRKVAVKLVKAGMDSKAVLARFEAERQALAVMDHPNIAKVLDGGTTDAGRPFFVMEYVRGVPVTAYCDDARLSIADRLALFVPICQAVQHAHQKGIIHRDLKPSNILICLYDGRPVPKVIDFGLAKAMHQPLTEHTLHTAHGQMMGTPLYMSPEQAEFNNLDVDTRTDVYALGVILYELLTGTTPLERDHLKRAAWDEMLRMIREEEPPLPSTRLSGSGSLPSVAAQRQLEPVRLTRLVRGELDWIVMKCLEKNRSRRYDTANGLANDVQRYLANEPVEAGPAGTGYRLRKFSRRHWKGLTAASLFILLLSTTAVTLAVALIIVNRERQAKESALVDKEVALQAEARRRKQARTALDAMSSQIIEDWLASQQVLRPENRRFLEQTLKFYEEFAADTAQDEESRAGVSEAFERVGEIRDRLGLRADAEAAWVRSRDLYAGLAADYPNSSDYRNGVARTRLLLGRLYRYMGRNAEAEAALRLGADDFARLATAFPTVPSYRNGQARCLDVLGEVLKNSGRIQEAEAAFGQAVAIWKDMIADVPAKPMYPHQLAVGQLNLGNLLNDSGRADKALVLFEQAAALLEPLVAAHPTQADYRDSLVRTLNSLGIGLRAAKRLPEAETTLRRAVAISNRLVADFPAVPIYRRVLGALLNTLGAVNKDMKRAKESEELYDQSLAVFKQLAADFPTSPDYQNEAATAMSNLAGRQMARNAYPEARRLLEEARTYHQAALKASPNHPNYRRANRASHIRMVETLIALKNHAAANTAIQELLQLAVDPPQDSYFAACLLAGCTRLAAQDDRLTPAERQEMSNAYADRALAELRLAVEKNVKEAAQMKTNPMLDPIRTRDGFTALLTEWEKKNPPRPGGLPAPQVVR